VIDVDDAELFAGVKFDPTAAASAIASALESHPPEHAISVP